MAMTDLTIKDLDLANEKFKSDNPGRVPMLDEVVDLAVEMVNQRLEGRVPVPF